MGGIPDMLEPKGYSGFKEGKYHKCSKCGKLVENYRTYIRTRQFAYDYDRGVLGITIHISSNLLDGSV
jgi:hypothetical protein